jgi:hypothetical protein
LPKITLLLSRIGLILVRNRTKFRQASDQTYFVIRKDIRPKSDIISHENQAEVSQKLAEIRPKVDSNLFKIRHKLDRNLPEIRLLFCQIELILVINWTNRRKESDQTYSVIRRYQTKIRHN